MQSTCEHGKGMAGRHDLGKASFKNEVRFLGAYGRLIH